LTDAAQVTLVIAASDETGVAFVRAAGFPAVLDPDSLWRVSVPLSAGINTLRVETRDTRGNQNPSATLISIRRGSGLWIEPGSLAFHPPTGDALVLDPPLHTVFRVRPTGARGVVTGPGVGSGVPLASPRDLDFELTQDALLVTDGQLDAVILVDVATGARTVLSSPTVGAGPTPLDLHGIAVDLLRNRALVVDAERAELMAVDLVTGQRSTISSDTLGTGASLSAARRVALDPSRSRALVTLESTAVILAVDLSSGSRTVLSGGAAGSGPAFVTPFDLAVDVFPDRALVADPGARAIFEVDLATGRRRFFSSPSVGNGPDWWTPAGVALRLASTPLVVDSTLDALIEVPLGDRRIVSSITAGSGPGFAGPVALADGLSFERLIVADATGLLTADAPNGLRELFSGPGRGRGGPFLGLSDVAVSGAQGCHLIALDAGLPGLVRVDLSGNRIVIPDGRFGFPFSRPRCMVLEPSVLPCLAFGTTALVGDKPIGDPAVILRVDLVTGNHSVLSDLTHGSGPDMVEPVAMEIDPRLFMDHAHVLDGALHSIFSLDLRTGDRKRVVMLKGLGTPTDMTLDAPRNRFLVTVMDPPALLVADVRSQTTTILSDSSRGTGPLFGRPVALELMPSATLGSARSTPIAFVLDASRCSILAVDTETGERVIRTK